MNGMFRRGPPDMRTLCVVAGARLYRVAASVSVAAASLSSAMDIFSLWVIRVLWFVGWWVCAYWTGGKSGGGRVAGCCAAKATAKWVSGPRRSGTSCGTALPLGCSPAAIRAATVVWDRLAEGVNPISPSVSTKGVSDPGVVRGRPLG